MSGIYSNCIMIKPDATPMDLQDGISQRLQQIEAVLTALTLDDEANTMSNEVFHNALWLVDTLVGEIRSLNSAQWEKIMAEWVEMILICPDCGATGEGHYPPGPGYFCTHCGSEKIPDVKKDK